MTLFHTGPDAPLWEPELQPPTLSGGKQARQTQPTPPPLTPPLPDNQSTRYWLQMPFQKHFCCILNGLRHLKTDYSACSLPCSLLNQRELKRFRLWPSYPPRALQRATEDSREALWFNSGESFKDNKEEEKEVNRRSCPVGKKKKMHSS